MVWNLREGEGVTKVWKAFILAIVLAILGILSLDPVSVCIC